MYTHELADALKRFATLLKRGPDVPMDELMSSGNYWMPSPLHRPKAKEDLPIALNALLSLSRVDKREWIDLINDLGLAVDVRPRDASRDILGKVLRVLESQPLAREKLERQVRNKAVHASPELAKALSTLLSR
jgi:hypothetical protein